MAINDGGAAFPSRFGLGDFDYEKGLSLRDWFAGQALAGYSAIPDNRTGPVTSPNREKWREDIAALDANYCYRMADAMLAAREKGGA